MKLKRVVEQFQEERADERAMELEDQEKQLEIDKQHGESATGERTSAAWTRTGMASRPCSR